MVFSITTNMIARMTTGIAKPPTMIHRRSSAASIGRWCASVPRRRHAIQKTSAHMITVTIENVISTNQPSDAMRAAAGPTGDNMSWG